jgi:hypothetical protein
MCELESLNNSNQNIIKEKTLFKKIQRKKKRKFKNTKKTKINNSKIYFTKISDPIPESEATKQIRKEIREEYYIKVEQIRQTYKDITEKEKILQIITELEELFYTALFEDLNTSLAKSLAYSICMEYELNTQEIFPFYLYKNK